MPTLFDIALKVAREVGDVMDGVATAGTTASLTDTEILIQPAQFWKAGTLFIKSGTHLGKALYVTGYDNHTLTFATQTGAIVSGDRFAVMRGIYPFNQIVTAVNQALEFTHVNAEDATLIGDGATLEFTLPTGVFNVKRVQFGRNTEILTSNHWRETGTKLRFDYGYAPVDGDTIRIVYRSLHNELSASSDVISNEIDREWLKFKAAEQLLWWGVSVYGNVPEYRIEEKMNKVIAALKGKQPRRDAPDIVMNTGGMDGGRLYL